MNNKFTFSLGWGLCFTGVMGGAIYGTIQGKESNDLREKVGGTSSAPRPPRFHGSRPLALC